MGNRAVITTKENFENNGVGVYVHWNGGYDSVSAFLKYCELKGYRTPDTDCYGWARLCQVIGNFFGGGCSVGIDVVNNLDCDNWDNGVYIIEGWKIVDRKYYKGEEQMNYKLNKMLLDIDSSMPENEQLGEYLVATEIPTENLKIGDIVFIQMLNGTFEKHKVIGFGLDKYVNGTNVKNLPYVDLYGDDEKGFDWNCNNYIKTKTVRIVETE